MKLAQKLFFSHLIVAFVSVIVIVLSVIIAAPRFVTSQVEVQVTTQNTLPTGELVVQEDTNGYHTVASNPFGNLVVLLMISGGVSVIIAGGMSWWMSRRIVTPIKAVALASTSIAEGHYQHRLPVKQSDELGVLVQHFNDMAQSLDAVETTRRQLLADISHELKTPLATIKGYMEGFEDGVIPATVENFVLVGQEVSRLQRLVHDMHEVSRTEAGFHALQMRPCDPAQILEQVAARLRPQFEGKGVVLMLTLPDELPAICADPERLEQVMLNLLGNALQYTPSGGEVIVSVEIDPKERQIHYHIKDTGIGIAPDDRKQIFQRFYRVDKSRARITGGSGIGLTIARAIVEAHGGRIFATSDGLTQGSIFTFTIPQA